MPNLFQSSTPSNQNIIIQKKTRFNIWAYLQDWNIWFNAYCLPSINYIFLASGAVDRTVLIEPTNRQIPRNSIISTYSWQLLCTIFELSTRYS